MILFLPLPAALDYELWMRASGLLFRLAGDTEPLAAGEFVEGWDERYESLVEHVAIDGMEYLALSLAGQIFHETLRARFRTSRNQVLPPPAPRDRKRPPHLEDAG